MSSDLPGIVPQTLYAGIFSCTTDFASNCTVIRGVSFNATFRISASFLDMENAGASFGPAISWAFNASLLISP